MARWNYRGNADVSSIVRQSRYGHTLHTQVQQERRAILHAHVHAQSVSAIE